VALIADSSIASTVQPDPADDWGSAAPQRQGEGATDTPSAV